MADPYEGRVTSEVEKRTSKLPSLTWMGFAVASMAASAALVIGGRKELGNFVGQWAPTFLIIGLYNKLTKEIALPKHESRGYGAAAGMGAGA